MYQRIVNRTYRLGIEDRPADLVEPGIFFAPESVGEKRFLRKEAAEKIEQMFESAKKQNIMLAGVSGYRSYERQKQIFETSVKEKGMEHAKRYIAPPGASEHQTGLAMDVSCESEKYELEETFAKTREGIWLRKNAYLFGFIIRYPKGKESITGYAYEPWHIRYVTPPFAFYLTKLNLTMEEYQSVIHLALLTGVPE